jgi:hypothetical protein
VVDCCTCGGGFQALYALFLIDPYMQQSSGWSFGYSSCSLFLWLWSYSLLLQFPFCLMLFVWSLELLGFAVISLISLATTPSIHFSFFVAQQSAGTCPWLGTDLLH